MYILYKLEKSKNTDLIIIKIVLKKMYNIKIKIKNIETVNS
jgi:hypothetical protein